jgi:hypothetical protein
LKTTPRVSLSEIWYKDKIRGYVRSLQLIVFGSLTDPLADRISVTA